MDDPSPAEPHPLLRSLLEAERQVLARVAVGIPLSDALDEMILALERASGDGAKVEVLFVDENAGRRLRYGAAPSLAPEYIAMLHQMAVGPAAGSAGAAAHGRVPVYAEDIADDGRWTGPLRAMALSRGLRACWSSPVLGADDRLLGTCSLYHPEPRAPRAAEAQALAAVSRTVALAMERHDSARTLSAVEARHRQILDSAVDYVIISLDLSGRVTRWNEGAHRILGWTEAEMLGQTLHRLFTPEDLRAQRVELEMAFAISEGQASHENWRVRRDGSLFWASGQMTPLKDDKGTVLGFVKILRDRTRQRAADLRQAFLLSFSDRLRPLTDSEAVLGAAVQALGPQMQARRCGYLRFSEDGRTATLEADQGPGSGVSRQPGLRVEVFGSENIARLRTGVTTVYDDVSTLSRDCARALQRHGVGAIVAVPLLKDRRLAAALYVAHAQAHRWTPEEVTLIEEVAARTWMLQSGLARRRRCARRAMRWRR